MVVWKSDPFRKAVRSGGYTLNAVSAGRGGYEHEVLKGLENDFFRKAVRSGGYTLRAVSAGRGYEHEVLTGLGIFVATVVVCGQGPQVMRILVAIDVERGQDRWR